MRKSRDDFPSSVRRILAHRAGYRCSKPDCRAATAGPSWEGLEKKTDIGVAAHITAAAPNGPRYDPSLTTEQRRSVENGLWLCQNHAKAIDDDTNHDVTRLRTWKEHAENYARAMLGRPISNHAHDAAIEVSLLRVEEEHLMAVGHTNLPSGTKLQIQLRTRGVPALQTSRAVVSDHGFASRGFITDQGPHPQDWYKVTVIAYFNGPWKQPLSVIEIVGREGQHLTGPYAQPIEPDVDDSPVRLEALFQCIAPPLNSASPLSQEEINGALEVLRESVIPRGDGETTLTIGKGVEKFIQGRHPKWTMRQISPNGLVEVMLSYESDYREAKAIWHVVPRAGSVRYRNSLARQMSRVYTRRR